MQKIVYSVNDNYSVKDMPGAVTIHMSDGRSLSHEVPRVGGDSQNPFSDDDILAKFYDCTAALPRARVDEIAHIVMNLEQLPDLSALSRLVSKG